jgi:DoxX
MRPAPTGRDLDLDQVRGSGGWQALLPRRLGAPVAARRKNGTITDLLFNGVGWTDVALTLNRIAVGTFFMLSGYRKLFNAQRHRTLVDELKALGVPAVGINQWWVPTVEFTAGAAVLRGRARLTPAP